MKKTTYAILTHLPIVGPIIKLKTQPMYCSPGLAEGFFDEQMKLIQEYQQKHPDVAITKQLIEQILAEESK